MPLTEWRKSFMPLLGGCVGAAVIGLIWGSWREVVWVLFGFVIATVVIVLIRLASHRWTSR